MTLDVKYTRRFNVPNVQSRTLVRGQANTAEAGKILATVYMHSQRQETQTTERTLAIDGAQVLNIVTFFFTIV